MTDKNKADVSASEPQFMVDGVAVAPLGADGLPSHVTLQYIETKIADKVSFRIPGEAALVCLIKMKSGQCVIGSVTGSDPDAFNETIAREVAFNNAMSELFNSENHALADKRHALAVEAEKNAEPDVAA